MTRLGFVCSLDQAVFAAFCQSFGRWRQAEIALKRQRRLTCKTVNGQSMVDPLVTISRQSANDMLRFGAELGLTAIARRRLGCDPPLPEDNVAHKYFDPA